MRLDSPKTVPAPLSAWVVGLAASCAVSSAIAADLFDAQWLIKQGQPSVAVALTETPAAQTAQQAAGEEVEPTAIAPDDPAAEQARLPKAIPGWDLIFSPYTAHYHSNEEYKPVVLLGLVKGLEGRWLAGAVAFSNSFGQASAYAYLGQRYLNPFGLEKWYLQWSAGLLYGYVGKYEDKVPYNHNGFSPGIVPSVGYQFSKHVYGELDVLGTAGLMFSVVFPLPRGTP